MKTLFTVIAILLNQWSVLAQTAQSSTIGDIKYSLLPPDKFKDLNPEWVLMDGRNISTSRLAKEYGITTLPDARGVFIRSMSVGRTFDQGGDSDPRTVGSFQENSIGSHNHAGLFAPKDAEWAATTSQGDKKSVNILQTLPQSSGKESFLTGYSGINETRPRNITLYLYVKIN